MNIFEQLESHVRTYSRSFPAVFAQARGAILIDEFGKQYIDFLSGAGSLNYGHNHPDLKRAVIDYLQNDGVVHSLDLATTAKARFIEEFDQTILQPRGLRYRFQFTGPTGTNGVEAALKLARKVTGRRNVVAFSGGYHGLSAGALAVTANTFYRGESFVSRGDVSFLPFDGFLGEMDTLPIIRKMLIDPASGIDRPAAIILEAVQSEGGVKPASVAWLQAVGSLCKEIGILLIVDDIQAGNGRTGDYFSFEEAGLKPDLVVLSKSISGLGLPMTLLLIRPELDVWEPGEHTGTFRGNNLAFVAAAEALHFWKDDDLAKGVRAKEELVKRRLRVMAEQHLEGPFDVRGRGLLLGLDLYDGVAAAAVRKAAFENGLIVELCGARNTVVKLLPPLITEDKLLHQGLDMLDDALAKCGARLGTQVTLRA